MKKNTLSLLVLLAGFAAAAGTASPDSKQWQVSNPQKVRFETDGKAIRLENSSKVWQVLELEPKTRYELTFFIKGENIQDGENRGARIVLISGKKHVRITSLFRDEPETGTFDWRKGFGIIDTAVFPDSKIRLELNLFGNGTVWFKDVQIKKQTSDTKGDFSNALKIDNKLSRWNFSPAKNVMPDSQIKIGEQSIRMNGPSRVWQVLEFEPDTQYELTFSVKGQNIQSDKNSGARIVLNDGKYWERFTSIPKPETGTFDWRTGRAVFDTGRFKSTRISFQLHLIGNGTVWYDDLKIIKIPK